MDSFLQSEFKICSAAGNEHVDKEGQLKRRTHNANFCKELIKKARTEQNYTYVPNVSKK